MYTKQKLIILTTTTNPFPVWPIRWLAAIYINHSNYSFQYEYLTFIQNCALELIVSFL